VHLDISDDLRQFGKESLEQKKSLEIIKTFFGWKIGFKSKRSLRRRQLGREVRKSWRYDDLRRFGKESLEQKKSLEKIKTFIWVEDRVRTDDPLNHNQVL
jgi:hypothetical protein